MLTSTHMLLGAAVSTRPDFRPYLMVIGWLGALFPDLSIIALFAYARIFNISGRDVWRAPDGLYWQEPWQTYSAISNSIPMWIAFSVVGGVLFLRSARLRQAGLCILVFAVAALSHVLGDFPVHNSDAHVHFWPFSDWRFHSPISYYQPAHYGDIFHIFEMVGAFALMIYFLLRFKQWPVRAIAIFLGVTPVIMTFAARALFHS